MSDKAARKQRITEIAEEMVTSMVASGELDPDNELQMDAACKQAVRDAAALYDAAIEYAS